VPSPGPGLACALLLLGSLAGSSRAQTTQHDEKSVLYAYRDPSTGAASLRARAVELLRGGRPQRVTFRAIRRFDPHTGTWADRALPIPPAMAVPVPASRQVYSRDTDPVILPIYDSVGLFWVAWDEDGRPATAFLYAGPILCNDVMLDTPPPGQIATCVPLPDRAVARFVPDPARRPQ
jgi:hypothetical protein